MKTMIRILLAGLAPLLLVLSGCVVMDKKDVSLTQSTPTAFEVESDPGQTVGPGSKAAAYAHIRSEQAGVTKYRDTSKHFEIANPIKGFVNAVALISVNGRPLGGGYPDECLPYSQVDSMWVENANYQGTWNNFHGRGGRGGQVRPYPQNTGNGRINRPVEQPHWQDAYKDRFGNFHPAGWYTTNGYSYPQH